MQPASSPSEASVRAIAMLLFEVGGDVPKAVPVAQLARLDEVDPTRIDLRDGRAAMFRCGQLILLQTLDGVWRSGREGLRPVLVFDAPDGPVGIVVDRVLDIVEEPVDLDEKGIRPGVLGSAVLGGRTTELIDAAHLVQAARLRLERIGG